MEPILAKLRLGFVARLIVTESYPNNIRVFEKVISNRKTFDILFEIAN